MAEFALFGRDLFGEVIKPKAGPLAAKFTLPPFSVLDARSGDWQARKRAWLSLGIESEVGRANKDLHNCHPETTSTIDFYAQKRKIEAETGGPKTKSEVAAILAARGDLSDQRGNTRGGNAAATRTSAASIFDPVLCELAYRWFCPPAGHVLDPFAGGSVRGIVAGHLGRAYTGIDLRQGQIDANRAQAAKITTARSPAWITGDSRNLATLAPGQYDFVFSCPPYGDLERYSDDPADLSTLDWPAFLAAYMQIIDAAVAALKPDRFACFVVGDFRDKRGLYRAFPAYTCAAFERAGAELYNEAVLVTSVGSLPVRVSGQFNGSRKLGKTHQNVLVFVKGDPRRAAEACEQSE